MPEVSDGFLGLRNLCGEAGPQLYFLEGKTMPAGVSSMARAPGDAQNIPSFSRSVSFTGDLLSETWSSDTTCTFQFACLTICLSSFLRPRKMLYSRKRLVRCTTAPRGHGQPHRQRGDPRKPSRIFASPLSLCCSYFIPTAGRSILS